MPCYPRRQIKGNKSVNWLREATPEYLGAVPRRPCSLPAAGPALSPASGPRTCSPAVRVLRCSSSACSRPGAVPVRRRVNRPGVRAESFGVSVGALGMVAGPAPVAGPCSASQRVCAPRSGSHLIQRHHIEIPFDCPCIRTQRFVLPRDLVKICADRN